MIVAQITDCHVTAPSVLVGGRIDTASTLRRVVDHINALRPVPDVVLATGDLTNDGLQVEYDRLAEILSTLTMPVLPIPGNHDDRTRLRAMFANVLPPGSADDPIDYVVDDFPLRFVALDTSTPGQHGGRLEPDQLRWLDRTLAAKPDRPTIVLQHHPPFVSGIAWMDVDAFEGAPELSAVLNGHPQVEAVVCGHLHRPIHRRFGGTVASCWPSTGVQLALALNGEKYLLTPESPAYAVHRWTPMDGLTSHVSQVDAEPWLPRAWTVKADRV
jgi:3',5'-cyclic-AMP phosphodiesterase